MYTSTHGEVCIIILPQGIALTQRADNGVSSAVFSTIVLPHAKAGPTFQEYIRRGKFHGTSYPATPMGSCRVWTW